MLQIRTSFCLREGAAVIFRWKPSGEFTFASS